MLLDSFIGAKIAYHINCMVKQLIGRTYGKKRYQRFFRRLLGISLAGLNLVGGGRSIYASGEAWAIQYVLSKSNKGAVVFDVGAQGGEYSEVVLQVNPDAIVYAFEPAKLAYDALVIQFQHSNIRVIPAALGAQAGTAPIYSLTGVGGLDSLYQLPDNGENPFKKSADVVVDTIDQFCEKERIRHIDLLKLDVEGSELSALKGATRMLINRSIAYIQFEHSKAATSAGYRFKDVYDLLSPRYKISRILQDGLEEIQRPSSTEDFPFAVNYLAELRQN